MLGQLTPDEQAQLNQTIEMFEVITAAQPLDYQSLEILKEAYLKLERQRDVVRTARRIASAYEQLGQLSSALLEYETILQRYPDDAEVLAAMAEIQNKARAIEPAPATEEPPRLIPGPVLDPGTKAAAPAKSSTPVATTAAPAPIRMPTVAGDNGRDMLRKIFVDGRLITPQEFDEHWTVMEADRRPDRVNEPFVQVLAERGNIPLEKSIKAISDRSRTAYLMLERYEIDAELARSFPKDLCRRWCVLPFDRMSKSLLVATANPFDKGAEEALHTINPSRIVWYLVSPTDLQKAIEKLLR